jgi:hypothetical protein
VASTLTSWTGEDVRLADVDRAIAQLRAGTASEGGQPSLRTSVMTHIAWVPEGWHEAAQAQLDHLGADLAVDVRDGEALERHRRVDPVRACIRIREEEDRA